MAVKLSFDEYKWLLKCYWKMENVVEVQRCWRVEFGTPPPTRVTITKIWDKFEVNGTVQDVLKGRCGRKRSSTDNKSADAVMQVFARSPKRSLRQSFREIGIEKFSVHQILNMPSMIPLTTIQMVCRSAQHHCWSVLWQKVDILNIYGLKEV